MAARAGMAQRPGLLLSGDGSATFNLTDLECATRQGLSFVMVVADDESWGITESGHVQRYGRAMASKLGPVEFAEVATGLGALGVRVESKEEFREALRRAVGERGG